LAVQVTGRVSVAAAQLRLDLGATPIEGDRTRGVELQHAVGSLASAAGDAAARRWAGALAVVAHAVTVLICLGGIGDQGAQVDQVAEAVSVTIRELLAYTSALEAEVRVRTGITVVARSAVRLDCP
jgi:hypothetical protein